MFDFSTMIEHAFSCPYCWQPISVLLDPSVPEQSYIEDCEVCCNPINFQVTFTDQELAGFSAEKMD